jgi:hypothetical protein
MFHNMLEFSTQLAYSDWNLEHKEVALRQWLYIKFLRTNLFVSKCYFDLIMPPLYQIVHVREIQVLIVHRFYSYSYYYCLKVHIHDLYTARSQTSWTVWGNAPLLSSFMKRWMWRWCLFLGYEYALEME